MAEITLLDNDYNTAETAYAAATTVDTDVVAKVAKITAAEKVFTDRNGVIDTESAAITVTTAWSAKTSAYANQAKLLRDLHAAFVTKITTTNADDLLSFPNVNGGVSTGKEKGAGVVAHAHAEGKTLDQCRTLCYDLKYLSFYTKWKKAVKANMTITFYNDKKYTTATKTI